MTEQTVTKSSDMDTLRVLIDLRNTVQKQRIAFGNRISAIERGVDSSNPASISTLNVWLERFKELESNADDDIDDAVFGMRIVEEMTEVKGVGKLLAAKIVALIDITVPTTVSKLWRYAGYGVVETEDEKTGEKIGKREWPTKGEKIHYNKRLKTTLYLLATSFLRTNSPYRRVYDDAREYYDRTRPDWTKGHKHAASMRKMIKMYLAHLWSTWRVIEGLPIRSPYVHEKLGHTTMLKATDFGWPVLKERDDYEDEI